jgi:hypothetical protein
VASPARAANHGPRNSSAHSSVAALAEQQAAPRPAYSKIRLERFWASGTERILTRKKLASAAVR